MLVRRRQQQQHLKVNVFSGDKPSSSTGPQPSSTGPEPLVFGLFTSSIPNPYLQPPPPPPPPAEQVAVVSETPITPPPPLELFWLLVLKDGRVMRVADRKQPWSGQSGRMTAHGLWLINNLGSKQQDKFDEKLLPSHLTRLIAAFPSVLGKRSHKKFWKYQWETHGRFGNMNQVDYFNFIVNAVEQLGPTLDAYIQSSTIEREGRKYLDAGLFEMQLEENEKLYPSIFTWTSDFQSNQMEKRVRYQVFKELRLCLETTNPYQTVDPRRLAELDGADPQKVLPNYHESTSINIV